MHAIISDIHGNLPALRSVLADIDRQGITRILCLGDIVGYGPNPVGCIDLVRRRCEVTLCGNHDLATYTQPFGFNTCARRTIDWTRKQLEPGRLSLWRKRARWRYLRDLPARYQEGGVIYVHGSPRNPVTEYVIHEADAADIGVSPTDKLRELFDHMGRLCFVGHTHHPGILTSDLKNMHPSQLQNERYLVPKGGKTIVNVGAVGQPRNGDPRACYVTFDGEVVQYHRVEYDIERVVADIAKIRDIDDRLGVRLREGK